MNITVFESNDYVFINCECIKGFTFRINQFREKSALLAKEGHMLTANFAKSGDNSVDFSLLKDCFECLLPIYYKAA